MKLDECCRLAIKDYCGRLVVTCVLVLGDPLESLKCVFRVSLVLRFRVNGIMSSHIFTVSIFGGSCDVLLVEV